MSGSLKQSQSVSDLNAEELDGVFGGFFEPQEAKGDSYVCTVDNGHIVPGSCVKVD